jgi:hypothetical protein
MILFEVKERKRKEKKERKGKERKRKEVELRGEENRHLEKGWNENERSFLSGWRGLRIPTKLPPTAT